MSRFISGLLAVGLLASGASVHAQVVPAPGAPPPYSGDGAAPRLGPVVLMRADKPRATLQVQTQLDWQDVCVTPCGSPVDPRGLFRVAGSGLVPSDTFTMPRPSGQVTIEAHVGSRGRNVVGIALTFVGLGALGAGGYLVAQPKDNGDELFGPELIPGVIALVSGVALTLTGFLLWATSGTAVKVE